MGLKHDVHLDVYIHDWSCCGGCWHFQVIKFHLFGLYQHMMSAHLFPNTVIQGIIWTSSPVSWNESVPSPASSDPAPWSLRIWVPCRLCQSGWGLCQQLTRRLWTAHKQLTFQGKENIFISHFFRGNGWLNFIPQRVKDTMCQIIHSLTVVQVADTTVL